MTWILFAALAYPLFGAITCIPTVWECARETWDEDRRATLYACLLTVAIVSVKWPVLIFKKVPDERN